MLPLPNLDDRTFEQLVREARDLLPSVFPEWTDENVHDPGITLLELLAWRLEAQQFRLNRVSERLERKFLRLLGEAQRERRPARAPVVFSCGRSDAERPSQALRLPAGTVLRAGNVPYETERSLLVVPTAGMRLILSSSSGTREVPAGDENGQPPFYPFGPFGETGAQLTVEMPEPLPANERLVLWIELSGEDGVQPLRIPPGWEGFVPSGRVEWMYESEEGWVPLPVESDETVSMHQSGMLRFTLPVPSRRLAVRLADGSYDRVPRIRRIGFNSVYVSHGLTHAVYETFDATGEPGQRLEPRHALFATGRIRMQVRRSDGGWIDWEKEGEPALAAEPHGGRVTVRVRPGPLGAAPPAGEGAIRLIALSPEFSERWMLGTGTGISGQSFELPFQPALPNWLLVQIGTADEESGAAVWHDWTMVPDFDRSGPDDRHYTLDDDTGMIRFSDGERGAVPPMADFPNIRIISLRIGGGEEGNVKEGQIRGLETPHAVAFLSAANIRPAEGGAEPETTGAALRRVQRDVLDPDCGVTAEDIERLVARIPGLAVARVKAVPGFRPGLSGYPQERSIFDVTVVVQPRSAAAAPKPSEGFLQTVRNALEPYRLLTTKFHVVPPAYVKISVRAVVVVDPRYHDRERQVNDRLLQLFAQWDFGRPVYKSDIYDAIHSVAGVVYVQDVWLTADGPGAVKEEGGDVRIPPNALAVSGTHEIDCVNAQ